VVRVAIICASLLVLSAACNRAESAPAGFHLALTTTAMSVPGPCEGRQIVVTALASHRFTIFGTGSVAVINDNELVDILVGIFKYRADKDIFVRASPDATFAEFVKLVDIVYPLVNVVSVITHQVDDDTLMTSCFESTCYQCVRHPVDTRSSLPDLVSPKPLR
jgi:hypothetical protein